MTGVLNLEEPEPVGITTPEGVTILFDPDPVGGPAWATLIALADSVELSDTELIEKWRAALGTLTIDNADAVNGLGFRQIVAATKHYIEQVTGFPTQSPKPSGAGRKVKQG